MPEKGCPPQGPQTLTQSLPWTPSLVLGASAFSADTWRALRKGACCGALGSAPASFLPPSQKNQSWDLHKICLLPEPICYFLRAHFKCTQK